MESTPFAVILKQKSQEARDKKRKYEKEENGEELRNLFLSKYEAEILEAANKGKTCVRVKEPRRKKQAAILQEELEKEHFKVYWCKSHSILCWECN